MTLLLVSAIGLSRSIEEQAPEAAFRLNPLNTDARVAWLVAKLNESGRLSPPSPELFAATRTGLIVTPIDARLHSLAAELSLRSGDTEGAYRLFRQAHRISHTEIHALQYLIASAIEAGDYGTAVEHIDVLLRRWPRRFDAVGPLLPQLLSQEPAYQAVMTAMMADAPWRSQLIGGLAGQEQGLGFAYRILMDLANSEQPPTRREISSTIRAFMAAKRYNEGYRLFRFTIPPEERHLAGFIHNSVFQADSLDAPPFSWQLRNTRAAEIRLSTEGSLPGAAVRFLNTPAKNLVLNQALVLPPGRYRLTAQVDASSLRAPRSLYWRISCLDPRQELLRLQVPEGSYQDRQLEAVFDVGQCGVQRIELATDVVAESWQNRYSGQVRFHFVKIERAELAETEG